MLGVELANVRANVDQVDDDGLLLVADWCDGGHLALLLGLGGLAGCGADPRPKRTRRVRKWNLLTDPWVVSSAW